VRDDIRQRFLRFNLTNATAQALSLPQRYECASRLRKNSRRRRQIEWPAFFNGQPDSSSRHFEEGAALAAIE
jgi:hypothetical protein